jgi:hypothetical protein
VCGGMGFLHFKLSKVILRLCVKAAFLSLPYKPKQTFSYKSMLVCSASMYTTTLDLCGRESTHTKTGG